MRNNESGADFKSLMKLDNSFNPPSDCGDDRCQDLFHHFIFIVVVPAACAFLILNIVFCCVIVKCCISWRKRKTANETEEQLATYEAIRRASTNLRRMSHNNSTPMLYSRSGSVSTVRNDPRRRGFRPRESYHSAPGTLQRHHRNHETVSLQDIPHQPPPPPPYGIPADYFIANNDDDDDAFWGLDIPLQDMQPEQEGDAVPEEDQEEDRHNPYPQGRHHRRQRPYSAANGYMTR